MPLATLSGVSSGDYEFQANPAEASALALSIPHDLHKSSLAGGSSSPKKDSGVGNRRSRNSSPSQIPMNSNEVNAGDILPKTSIPAIVRPLNFNNIGLSSFTTEFSSENSESISAATFDPVATSDSGRRQNLAHIVPVMSNIDGHSTGTSLLHDNTANTSNSATTQKSYDEGHTSDQFGHHPHAASNNHISIHILPDAFHLSSVYRVPQAVPIPVTPATMPLPQRLGVIAEYLSDIGYNFTGPDLTPHVQVSRSSYARDHDIFPFYVA